MARSDSTPQTPGDKPLRASKKAQKIEGSDSSKKVAKAARAGAGKSSRRSGEKRDIGFPLAMAAVIFFGVALVVFARNSRDVSALTPTFDDHWHAAYGIYDCTTGDFLPNLADPQTPNPGIHTHGDGVVHIHPRGSDATGRNAQLSVFLDATRTSIEDDTRMTFPDREDLTEEGVECDGEPAVLQIARFAPGEATPSEVIDTDLADFRFEENLEALTIALAPAGAEIPPPPQTNIQSAQSDSGVILGTEDVGGLNDLDLGGLIAGEDEDGNLVDTEGNIIVESGDVPDLEDELDEGTGSDGDTDGEDTDGEGTDDTDPATDDPASDDTDPASEETE